MKSWPLAVKIAVGFLALLVIACTIGIVIALRQGPGSYEARKALRDDRAALFDFSSQLQLRGDDGEGLIMLDSDCTPRRARAWARDYEIVKAGFAYVGCVGEEPVPVER